MDRLQRIFWLGTKELRAVTSDVAMVVMIIIAFTLLVVCIVFIFLMMLVFRVGVRDIAR